MAVVQVVPSCAAGMFASCLHVWLENWVVSIAAKRKPSALMMRRFKTGRGGAVPQQDHPTRPLNIAPGRCWRRTCQTVTPSEMLGLSARLRGSVDAV
jgi:hypothetical protein